MHRGKAIQKVMKLRSSQQPLEQDDDDFQHIATLKSTQPVVRVKSPIAAPLQNYASQPIEDDLVLETNENARFPAEQVHERQRTARPTYPQESATLRRQDTGQYRQALNPSPRKRQYQDENFDYDTALNESTQPTYGVSEHKRLASANPSRRPVQTHNQSMDDDIDDTPRLTTKMLQEKYERILNIRYTEPEALCQRLVEATDRQNKESDALIQQMQLEIESKNKENAELNKEMLELRNEFMQQQQRNEQSVETEREQRSNEVAVLKAKLARLQAQRTEPAEPQPVQQNDTTLKDMVDIYEDLTGMIITGIKQTEDGDVINCVQNGNQRSIHFRLTRRDGRNGDYYYEPLVDPERDSAALENLTDTMRHNFTFQHKQAPVFHCKLAYALLQTKKR